jgi:signal transduction histidine kinase
MIRAVLTLEAYDLFSGLTTDDFGFLRSVVSEKTLQHGEEIFHEGDPGDGLYLVRKGVVEISVRINQKDKRVFTRVLPGEMFGEMAVIEEKPRSACAVVLEDASLYFISTQDFLRLVKRCPDVAMATMREVSSRLREFNTQFLREVIQAERLAVVGRFARSIVHDLKNPLGIISITSELSGMADATVESRQQGRVRIAKQVERINEMISEILEFTQPARGDVVLCPLNFGQFASQLLAEIGQEAGLKSVSLQVMNPPPDISASFDPKRLRRVFQNLVHNAVEAMPEGGNIYVRFQVGERRRTSTSQPATEEIVTEIEDTGPGIAPEIADRLFEAFATHGKAHGTGLGLSICRKIMEDHQGWITAGSALSGGACFRFAIPTCNAHSPATASISGSKS